MSYDLGVWADPDGRYRGDPEARYEALCELIDNDPPSAQIEAFVAELEQRWPGGGDDGQFEDSPWATWPLRAQTTASGVVLNLTYSAAADVVEQVIELAHDLRLTVYDPQADQVYARPLSRPRARRAGLAAANLVARSRIVRVVITCAIVAGLLLLVDRCSS